MLRFAANLSLMFNEWDFLDRFQAAADAGFEAVEYLFPYDYSPDQISSRLIKNKLAQALFNFPAGNWGLGERGLAALPDRKEEFRTSVIRALEYAKATGVKRLHLMSGIAPQDAKHQACFKEAVFYAASSVAEFGINILLEPINGRDMPGYFMNDFEKASRLIEELSLPNVKLQFDIYHRQILHGDVTMALRQLLPIIDHVQIASIPLRNEPGTGELDDFRIFAALDQLGYRGYVGCEYRPRTETREGLIWRHKLPQ